MGAPLKENLKIETPRLTLIATRIEHLDAELESPAKLGELLRADIPASWPPGLYDRDAMQFFRARLVEGGPTAEGWYGWYVLLRGPADSPPVLVAACGYMGRPAGGWAEIGYSVAPEHRGRGIATECVRALVDNAFAMPDVFGVSADVHETNASSLAVMERSGFVKVGPGRETGYLRFELARGAA